MTDREHGLNTLTAAPAVTAAPNIAATPAVNSAGSTIAPSFDKTLSSDKALKLTRQKQLAIKRRLKTLAAEKKKELADQQARKMAQVGLLPNAPEEKHKARSTVSTPRGSMTGNAEHSSCPSKRRRVQKQHSHLDEAQENLSPLPATSGSLEPPLYLDQVQENLASLPGTSGSLEPPSHHDKVLESVSPLPVTSASLVSIDVPQPLSQRIVHIFDELEQWPVKLEECERQIEGAVGSDEDEEPETMLPGNMASDFPAELPDGIEPEVARRIQEVDAANDSVICSLLSPADLIFDWRSEQEAFQGRREVFTGVAGPTFPSEDLKTPVDSFLKIWDEEILDLIVRETNLYAERVIQASELKEHSRLKNWHPITREELLVFFAVLMVQALYPLPVEKHFFHNTFRYAEMPTFKTMMGYERFILIKKFLHFVSDDNLPSSNEGQAKLHKIQPILEHLSIKFAELYMPEQEIALDESLLKWKGRLSFAQKIASKAAEGIKSNEICESRTGYLWAFKTYTGKGSRAQSHAVEPLGVAAKIVHDLARPLFNKGHTLVMDNFYNSPLLSRCLKQNGTDVMGTLRINHEFVPQSLKETSKASMRIGEVRSSYCKDMSVLLWRDSNNLVGMISTYHPVGCQEKNGETKHKPQVIQDYNKIMGGVDKKDELLVGFPMERDRNCVWYKKLFRRLLNISVLNSYVMFRHTKAKANLLQRDYREELVLGLLALFQPTKPTTVSVKAYVPLTARSSRPILIGNHFIEKGANGVRSRCVFCKAKGRESRTGKRCDVCLVPLCAEFCFKAYHTME